MKIRYLIVGSGYRAEYYGRIARKYPALFSAMFLCRSEEKARLVEAHTGIAGTTDTEKAIVFEPDFVVVAVNREKVGAVSIEWAERGFPVLAETPVASSMDELEKIWTLSQRTGVKISSSEQYHRYPILAAGLSCVQRGEIGTPVSMYLSLAHEYHGFSLIRRGLQARDERYSVCAMRTSTDQIRSSTKYVSYKDIKQVVADLKKIYTAVTLEEAESNLAAFSEKWRKQYPSCVRSWEENWEILSTFFEYPMEIRRIIYTTNIIEGLNRQFRQITKNKPSFTNDDSLRRMLYLASQRIIKHWHARCQNWDLVLNQLQLMFADRALG